MGKSSKRKAQASVNQITDSPKKVKLELTNKLEQESSKVKKNKKQENEGKILKTNINGKSKSTKDQISHQNKGGQKSVETKKKVKSQMNKNTRKAKAEGEVQFIIPVEIAQNLNKRMKHAVSKKVRNLIKIRQARGENVNKVDIDILVKEIIEQKGSNKADNIELRNDQQAISTNKIGKPKKKKNIKEMKNVKNKV